MTEVVVESKLVAHKTIRKGTPRISAAMRWFGFVVVLSFAYLYFDLFASSRVPFLLGGDQVFYWMGAMRLLSGQAIFRDFFQYTPPGTDLVYAVWFKIFGSRIWVTNAVVLSLGVLSTLLCFSLSRQLMRTGNALIAAGLFLVVIYGMFLNATNHWFAVFFILLAVRVSINRITARGIALSGTLLAFAAFFNQAHGAVALVGFIAFILASGARTRNAQLGVSKAVVILTLSFALVVMCIGAYYFSTAGFERLWFCLVKSVLHSVGRSSTFPTFLGLPPGLGKTRLLPYLLVYSLLPLIYGFAFLKCWRSKQDSSFPWDSVMLLSTIGFFLFAEVAVSVNPMRLFAIAMPAIILLIWTVESLRLPSSVLIVAASTVLAAVSLHQIVEKHRLSSARGELAGGRFATTPETYEKMLWLAQRAHPGEFLLEAGWPGVYLPLNVQSPLYMQTLSEWDCVTERDITPAIQQIEAKQTRYVLWTNTLDQHCEFSTCNDYLSHFRQHLTASFQPVQTFPDGDTAWERKSELGPLTH